MLLTLTFTQTTFEKTGAGHTFFSSFAQSYAILQE